LFTHELLDEYTAAYTTSETPFTSWITVVSRRYSLHGQRPFCSEETFRSGWFGYAKLQYLEGDMLCPKCGPSPENTIWDGVTLAFNRKHLLPTLEPPTVTQETSFCRNGTKYLAAQQVIVDANLRKLIRKIVKGPPLEIGRTVESVDDEDEEDDIEDVNDASKAATKAKQLILERIEAVPVVIEQLKQLNTSLGELFDAHYGYESILKKVAPPIVYKQFFIQVFSI
jgi:hypothetical protein